MRSIYVAGSSRELDRVEGVMRALRDAAWTITHDWTADVRAAQALGLTDATLTRMERERHARADTSAIDAADVFLLLIPTTSSIGVWFEFGYALARGIRTIAAGPGAKKSIFTELATVVYRTDDAAIEALCGRARRSA